MYRMNTGRCLLPAALALLLLRTGCQTTAAGPAKPTRAGEMEMKTLTVAGVKLGDPRSVVKRFRTAKHMDSSSGLEVYEIYKPNAQISMLVLTFRDGKLWKTELRYFKGPTESSFTATRDWNGLRDIFIKRFGPPVKVGVGVPQLHAQLGLNPAYARFNGVWDFPKINRQMQHIALSDSEGGVGIVTFIEPTPRVLPTPPLPLAPNPGF